MIKQDAYLPKFVPVVGNLTVEQSNWFSQNGNKPASEIDSHVPCQLKHAVYFCLAARGFNVDDTYNFINEHKGEISALTNFGDDKLMGLQQDLGFSIDKNGVVRSINLIDLTGLDLGDPNSSIGVLVNAALYNSPSCLLGSNMPGVHFANNTFEGADLRGNVMDQAVITYSNFRKAKLDDASLRNALFEEVHFTGASLRNADMQGIVCVNFVCFRDADLRGASLRNADMVGAKVSAKTNFTGADLGGAIYLPWDPSINRWGYLFARNINRETRKKLLYADDYGNNDLVVKFVSNVLEAGNKLLQACGLNRQR
jgi:uncharacterized protein YjbI with pentapeptide repeats